MTRGPVLVTGSGGRLGRALQRLGASGTPMFAMTGSRGDDPERRLDVTDPQSTLATISAIKPAAIVHLASIVGRECENDPATAARVNVGGTAAILAAAQAAEVARLVFISTAAVYGDRRRRPVSEQDSTDPTGVYATTKLTAEEVLASSAGDVAVDVLRVFNVYGPGMPDSLVTRLQTASAGAPAHLTGLDGFVRDYVHVDDVARAILSAAESDSAGFRVLNVGSGIPTSNRDLLDSLPQVPREAVVIGPEVDSYSCADITAISSDLGWSPREPWPPADR
ncbi:MAG: SDR family oxidoreductase [Actinobacteria bacterium]|nr:SDR family oxidoreductase [Actinomycetota bacterium]